MEFSVIAILATLTASTYAAPTTIFYPCACDATSMDPFCSIFLRLVDNDGNEPN